MGPRIIRDSVSVNRKVIPGQVNRSLTRLVPRIKIVVLFLGWFHAHRVENIPKLLLHLFIFLVLLKFVFSIRGASGLPIDSTQTEMGHSTGGVKLDDELEKGLGFLWLTHGHQDLR